MPEENVYNVKLPDGSFYSGLKSGIPQTAQVPPAGTAPMTPNPLPNTPGFPTTPSQTQTQQATAPLTEGTPQQTGANAQQMAQSGQLVVPQSGSVVDLLNMAGQDSSFAARQNLAAQFGIQNYRGTAAQNQELSKRFIEAFNELKGTQAPQTGAEARAAITSLKDSEGQKVQQDPTQQFMDIYASMNPIEANIFQQLSGLLSSTNTQQSLRDLYAQEVAAQGLPALNMELADINRIMEGTEDDIRAEITNAGGFATESQVQALTAARNKGLIKRANYLSNVIQAKNDYVDRIVSLTGADREQIDRDLTRKLGIAGTVLDLSQRMQDNARSNYQNIVDTGGWSALASMTQNDPQRQQQVEQVLGLAPGSLSNQDFLAGMQEVEEWGTPFVLGGSYVQQNSKTGEIRTAASLKSEGGGGLTPYQLASFTAGLRDDVRTDPDVKDFVAIRDGYERIKTGANLGTGPGDLAIIFGYMKMLDPTSVVRETEFSNAETAIGYAQKALNLPDKFLKGTRLTQEGRQFFVNAAERLYETKKVNYDNAVQFYKESGAAYGIPPEYITRDFASTQQQANIPKGAILIERDGQKGYVTSPLEFNPKTDKMI